MSDLRPQPGTLEHLRAIADFYALKGGQIQQTCQWAADEIERLRDEAGDLELIIEATCDYCC